MSVIRWEDPPPAGANSMGKPKHLIAHELVAIQLKRRPGEWGVVLESPSVSSLANQINLGRYAPYRPAGSFHAVNRIVDGQHVTYACYVGGGES
jgi:hypothetical protein